MHSVLHCPCPRCRPRAYSCGRSRAPGGNPMSRRWPIPLALALALVAGCSREDVPRLARVGRKAAARFEGLAGGAHGRLITEVRQAVPVEGGPGLAQRRRPASALGQGPDRRRPARLLPLAGCHPSRRDGPRPGPAPPGPRSEPLHPGRRSRGGPHDRRPGRALTDPGADAPGSPVRTPGADAPGPFPDDKVKKVLAPGPRRGQTMRVRGPPPAHPRMGRCPTMRRIRICATDGPTRRGPGRVSLTEE
jgi:hypothetical protein